jgi:uncharacterized protein
MIKEIITGSLTNAALITAVVSMFLAQVIKIIYYSIVERKVNWLHCFEAGGMPSSHSASVCALSMMVGLREGFSSTLFAAVVIFAAIVMYDAIVIRAEEVEHTLIEVSAGGLIGIVIALIFHLSVFRG